MASFLKKYITKTFSKSVLKEDIQLLFLKRLYRLLAGGYTLIAALEVMKWDHTMKQVAKEIILALKSGNSLDKAFNQAKFHDTIVAYLYFVRVNGNLLISLEKCIAMFEHRITYIKKFTNVIRYPIVLFIFFILLLFFIKHSILPSFIELFQSSAASSAAVSFSILFINIMSTTFIGCVFLILLGALFWHYYKRHMAIESQIKIYSKIPFYRTYITLQNSYYFATHISMFLKAGMPMKEVLENMRKQTKLPILSHYATLMTEQLKNGLYIDQLLLNLSLIDIQLAKIFQKNNNNDALEKDLTAFADILSETLERKIMQIITLIQPVFFVILACFIIIIYMTLMWPMFQLIQTV